MSKGKIRYDDEQKSSALSIAREAGIIGPPIEDGPVPNDKIYVIEMNPSAIPSRVEEIFDNDNDGDEENEENLGSLNSITEAKAIIIDIHSKLLKKMSL